MEIREKLNPQRSYRKGFALKGNRVHIIKTNNPSTIEPDELLTVRFPDLKENQLIVPRTTKLPFNISLAGTDVNLRIWAGISSENSLLSLRVMRSSALTITMSYIRIMTAGNSKPRGSTLYFKV